MKLNLVNEVMKEDSLLKFVLVVESILEADEKMLEPPEESVRAGIDLLKHAISGAAEWDKASLDHAIKTFQYLFRLLEKAKPALEDEIDAFKIKRDPTAAGKPQYKIDPKKDPGIEFEDKH